MLRSYKRWMAWVVIVLAIAASTGSSMKHSVSVAAGSRSMNKSSEVKPVKVQKPVIPVHLAPINVGQSEPVTLKIPAISWQVKVDSGPCPLVSKNGQYMLEPDELLPQQVCYALLPGKPYVLPGSNSPDVTVIACHTWPKYVNHDGVMSWELNRSASACNPMYDWDAPNPHWAIKLGDELWVQTRLSGARWLVYRATGFYTPGKYGAAPGSLANDPEIWGVGPEPNTLLLIACLRPSDGGISTRNIVIKWSFMRVAR